MFEMLKRNTAAIGSFTPTERPGSCISINRKFKINEFKSWCSFSCRMVPNISPESSVVSCTYSSFILTSAGWRCHVRLFLIYHQSGVQWGVSQWWDETKHPWIRVKREHAWQPWALWSMQTACFQSIGQLQQLESISMVSSGTFAWSCPRGQLCVVFYLHWFIERGASRTIKRHLTYFNRRFYM